MAKIFSKFFERFLIKFFEDLLMIFNLFNIFSIINIEKKKLSGTEKISDSKIVWKVLFSVTRHILS